MRDPQWFRLFPDEDFRWSMSLRPGEAVDFFAPSALSDETLALRRKLLADHEVHYLLSPTSAADLVREALERIARWTGRTFIDGREAGSELEPDWVLMRPDKEGRFRVEAGVVCFPSLWSLPEKAGLPIEAVHSPVPQLNEALGRQIGAFLGKLAPGTEWERENWGFSADGEFDHHPRLERERLTGAESLNEMWLRLERQLFARLPGGGLLFGIRVSNHRLDELVAAEPGLATRIARALGTMPEETAEYKGIAEARAGIAKTLGLSVPPTQA